MTTPAGGQISMGDLKSELSLVGGPSYDISIYNCQFDVMADGFWDVYSFSGKGGNVNGYSLSDFYNLQTDASFVFYVQSNITDYDQFQSTLTNQSQASGVPGPNAKPNQYRNPASGSVSPGYNTGVNIVHCDTLDVSVICTNNSGTPPFADLYIEYDNGSGYTPFPGSPFSGPSLNVNSNIQSNAPNNVGTPTFYVQCYM